MSGARRPVGEGEVRIWTLDGVRVAIPIDTLVFPLPVVMRAVYTLMDRAWFFLQPEGNDVIVVVRAKEGPAGLPAIVDELGNALVDARVRADIAAATMGVHELIVAEAFAPLRGGAT